MSRGCQNREAGADRRRWPQPEPGNATPDSTGGLQPPAPPVTTALRVEHGSTTPRGVLLRARKANASRSVCEMPTRRLTGTSVNTGPDARCDDPLHGASRSDRRTHSAAGRVGLSMAQKTATAASPHRAEAQPEAADARRPRAA